MKISKANLVKAVKSKCRDDCCCGDIVEAKECDIKTCPLLEVKNLFFNGKNHTESTKSNRGCREN